MANLITSLDIGSSSLKGMVGEKKKDGTLHIIAAFSEPSAGLRRGMLVDIEEATHLLRNVILDLQKISRRATENIYVNVSSEHVKARHSRGIAAVARADQEIQQDDIDRVLQASQAVKLSPNTMVLHNIIREYFVDDIGDISQPVGMNGNRLEVSTVMIETFAPQVKTLLKTLERVGAEVGGLIFNPLAAAQAVLSKKQKELGVCMVDFGFGTTSLVVYEENKVMHAKCLPIGVGYVTNDIAIGLKTSIDVAEKLKLSCGFAVSAEVPRRDVVQLAEFDTLSNYEVPRRLIAEIIEVRLVEILDLVHNEVKLLGKNIQLPGGIVITGGGSKMNGMADLVKQELKLPVQIGYPNLNTIEILNPTYQNLIDDPQFTTAVGLMIRGDDELKKPVSAVDAVKGFFKNLIP